MLPKVPGNVLLLSQLLIVSFRLSRPLIMFPCCPKIPVLKVQSGSHRIVGLDEGTFEGPRVGAIDIDGSEEGNLVGDAVVGASVIGDVVGLAVGGFVG